MSTLSPNIISYRINKELKSHLLRFKERNGFYNLNLEITSDTIERFSSGKMIGIGADEFHVVKFETPSTLNFLEVDGRKIFMFYDFMSYELFSKLFLQYLRNNNIVKIKCKIRRLYI